MSYGLIEKMNVLSVFDVHFFIAPPGPNQPIAYAPRPLILRDLQPISSRVDAPAVVFVFCLSFFAWPQASQGVPFC